jgi:hypothetical protein
MDKIWFIIKEHEHVGPYSVEDLLEFYQEDKIAYDTAVWKTGMDEPIQYRGIGEISKRDTELMEIVDDYDYDLSSDEDEIFDILNDRSDELELDNAPETFDDTDEPPPLPPMTYQPVEMVIKHEEPSPLVEVEESTDLLDDLEAMEVSPLNSGEELASEEIDDDSYFVIAKTESKTNWLLIGLALIVLGIFSRVGYEVYHLYFAKFSRPVGMMQRDYKQMTQMLSVKGARRSLSISFAKDYSKVWASLNFPFKGRVLLELKSIKGKVLTSDPVVVSSSATIKNKLITFNRFNFEQGIRLFPGYYEVHLKLLNKKKLDFWLERFVKLPKVFDIKKKVYIGKLTEQSFERELTKFLIKRNSIDTKFRQDLFQRFDTLRLIVSQIHDDFAAVLSQSKHQDFKVKLKEFERKYQRKYGQFLTSFVLENEDSFKTVRSSVSRSKTQLIAQHNKLSNLSRQVGETSMDILVKLSNPDVATNIIEIDQIQSQLMRKLVSIEITCKNTVSIIKSKM